MTEAGRARELQVLDAGTELSAAEHLPRAPVMTRAGDRSRFVG